jgi:uncharacterized RDD family membrane protein YckC
MSSEPSKSPAWAQKLALRAGQVESLLLRRLLIVGVLGVMVMFGLFLSNYSSEKSHDYWYALFPIFGIACLAHELASSRAYEIALWRVVLRQALHWLGPIVAVEILFMQHARGQMSTDAVALTIILVLATTSFLAGVHFDGSFYWVSAVLIFAALIKTEIETYFWLVLAVMVIGSTIAVLSAIALHHRRRQPGTGDAPTPIS